MRGSGGVWKRRAWWGGRAWAGAATAALALAAGALWAGAAAGERAQGGDVIASFDAQLTPHKLPRRRFAPAAVRLSSDFETADGALIPRLKGMTIDLSRRGRLSTEGLPSCSAKQLEPGFPARALATCRKALVGHGHVSVIVALPGQEPFPFEASLFAFNGRAKGGLEQVLVLVYGPTPSASFIIPFTVHRGHGELGTRVTMSLDGEESRWARLVHLEVELRRRYVYRGRVRSFINAECPLPKGFTGAVSPFARATFRFAGGQQVTTAIARACRVASP